MYRVELKGGKTSSTRSICEGLFLMYRVELKDLDGTNITVFNVRFLMYRVELKEVYQSLFF